MEAIGTVVECQTRFTMLVHLPREEGYRVTAPVKNGPALGGYGAMSMSKALASTMATMPEQLGRSLTWDRGKVLSAHAAFTVDTGTDVSFADPHSPWQRGTSQNANGAHAPVLPQGERPSGRGRGRPRGGRTCAQQQARKTLNWKTPAEAMNEHLLFESPRV